MVYMRMVRPTLKSDIKKLEYEFVRGYREGDRVFHVLVSNEEGEQHMVTVEVREKWSPLWEEANDVSEKSVLLDPDLADLKSKMFFVYDGNHRLLAWKGFIDRLHSEDRDWHILVDSICLDTTIRSGELLNAMHDINMSTENSHVKTNMVHTLHRINKYGSLKLESFKPLLSDKDYKTCENRKKKAWYPLTQEVFVLFLFNQEL